MATSFFVISSSRYLPATIGVLLIVSIFGTNWTTAAASNPPGCRRPAGDKVDDEGLCCQGKNSSCLTKGPRTSARSSTTCFCDAGCVTFGDCCLDYHDTCPVQDCRVSKEWGEWSDCDVACGIGKKRRRRRVLFEAKNGGRPCSFSDLEQLASCRGTNCKVPRAAYKAIELAETGRILPASFASWRGDKLYSPFRDIRRNLFEHYGDPNAVHRPAYCARYRLTDVHSTCRKMSKSAPDRWPERLVRGETLCVECQPFAMQKSLGSRCRGHGVLHKHTAWKATTVPGCHGKWKLVTPFTEQCDCNPDDKLSFVLV